jgi:hypothetical protein
METNSKNLLIGFLIGSFLIVLWIFIPYNIKERSEIKQKREYIDSLKFVQNPINRPKTQEKLYQSKVKSTRYTKKPSVIHNFDGSMNVIYKDTVYIGASMKLYARFLLDSD